VSGTFRDLHHTRNAMSRSISLLLQSRVTAGPDRTIEWRGTRYAEVEPLVFTSLDGRNTIMFRHDGDGTMMLHAWGATHERIEWYEGAAFHVVFVATCAIVFALYPTTRLIKRLRRGAPGPDGRPARWCAVAIALANLLFMVWLVFSLRGLGASAPLPAATSYGSRCH
jgi:hypothetical protein